MRSLRILEILAVLALLLWPSISDAAASKKKARGTIAVVNISTTGSELVTRVTKSLTSYIGGWARHQGIGDHLAGKPHPAAMPTGRVGLELEQLVRRLRSRKKLDNDALFDLGRLLGVDYLLLIKGRSSGLSARLFSVHRRAFAPQGFERADRRIDKLQAYLKAQTQPAKKSVKKARWWVWAAAAAVAAATIALAVATGGDDRKGDLRIRVSR